MRSLRFKISAIVIAAGVLLGAYLHFALRPARAQGMDLSSFLLLWEQTYGPASLHVAGSSANVANAAAVATLPASTTGRTTYISHLRCSGGGATAAAMATITVAGPATSVILQMGFVAGVLLANVPVDYVFDPPLPASAPNTAITVTMAAGGAGNTNASCSAEGFQL
jgi:hypothetical protein